MRNISVILFSLTCLFSSATQAQIDLSSQKNHQALDQRQLNSRIHTISLVKGDKVLENLAFDPEEEVRIIVEYEWEPLARRMASIGKENLGKMLMARDEIAHESRLQRLEPFTFVATSSPSMEEDEELPEEVSTEEK